MVSGSEKSSELEVGASEESGCTSACKMVDLVRAGRSALDLRHAEPGQPHPEVPGSGWG